MNNIVVLVNKDKKAENKFWKYFFDDIFNNRVFFLFWDDKEQAFFDFDGNLIEDFFSILLNKDKVVNLLSDHIINNKIFLTLEQLGLTKYQNSLSSTKLFDDFFRAKEIFRKYKIKIPVREKIDITGKTAREIFTTFIFPAKIVGKDDQINNANIINVQQLQEILLSHADDKLYLEEIIEGQKINCFVSFSDVHKIIYWDYPQKYDLSAENKIKIEKEINQILKIIGSKDNKYVLLEFVIRKNHGTIYLQNMDLSFNLFYKKSDIIDNIIKRYNIKKSKLFAVGN